ncbi:EamA family transporter [Photobacterium leiognathi]|uniref:EamA family transporter n=1 Tax=Photobacterium leiognathi TaxID=553611 RepID=UPI002982B56C|nr:EamA family transporter [Photobacterium leiognathi]
MMFTLIIVLSVFFSSSSQLLLKKGAETLVIPSVFTLETIYRLSINIISNIYLVGGVLFQVIALLVWIYVLKKVDVSYAYPFISLGFVFVIFMGYLLYNEPIGYIKLAGSLIICIGVFILSKAN